MIATWLWASAHELAEVDHELHVCRYGGAAGFASDANVSIEFFADLARERLWPALAGLDPASGKLPPAREVGRARAPRGERSARSNDRRTDHGHNHPSSMPTTAFGGRVASVAERWFGEIDGVLVGATWITRAQAAAAAVHRPLQAGISGSAAEGADSIVVSGG